MSAIHRRVGLGTIFMVAISGTWAAAEPVQQQNSNAVWFVDWSDLRNATMVVVAPDGQITDVTAASGTPVFQLGGADVRDGIYRFELRAQTSTEIPIVTQDANNGRETSPSDKAFEMFHTSGFFIVERGIILAPTDVVEEDG